MTAAAPTRDGVALVERSLAYTRLVLDDVRDADGPRPTPCSDWDVTDLLVHMVDSLEVVTEMALGRVAVAGPPPTSDRPEALADHLRVLGCALIGEWTARGDSGSVLLDRPGGGAGPDRVSRRATPLTMDARLAARLGALEVAVHGWDLSAALGPGAVLPPRLAAALLPVAVAHAPQGDRVPSVGRSGRAPRFAPPRVPPASDPSSLLLAHLGRDPRWPGEAEAEPRRGG
jgi:uncharacterized protein (TIGR03086 family)